MVDITFLALALGCLIVSLGFMTIVFTLSRIINRTDVVDVAWGWYLF